MKRAYLLLLALLMILAGCTGKAKTNDVSVKDVCCPYEIKHQKDAVEITLRDGEKRGILWQVDAIPGDVCQVTQETIKKDYTSRYQITGLVEGVAQLTFTASQENEKPVFAITLVIEVNEKGKVIVSSCQHWESADTTVEANGLNYIWNVDMEGILNFSFINSEDSWRVQGDGEGICILTSQMSTPSGCKFSAQASSPGQTTILLVGSETKREIRVTIQVDDSGKMDVISVQEQ